MKLFAIALALCAPALAQTVTGALTGHVADPTGAAVGDASLELVEPATRRVRAATTDSSGEFVLSGIAAGDYTLSVAKAGFKKFSRTDIHVEPGQRLVLGELKMEIGNLIETVSVTGELGAVVASPTSDRSALLSRHPVTWI